ncbi:MAG: hypothetical protein IJO36_10760 [Clostridia bacterium]|nr:hypothetical protein [Clostridia bacterium]
MKKLLSLLLAFVLAVGVFSIAAYADNHQLPDFSAISAEVYLTNPDGVTNHLYLKNGKAFVDGMKLPIFNGISIKTNILLDGNYLYIYLTSFPLFYFKFNVGEIEYIDPTDTEYTYIKSYNEKIGNTTYYVDEYMHEDTTSKYYYLNDEFKFCKSIEDGYTTTMTLESTDVDDRIFKIPFYSINITFIFDWLFPEHIM